MEKPYLINAFSNSIIGRKRIITSFLFCCLTIVSNKPEDPLKSTQASYVGFQICNTTGGILTGVEVDMSNLTEPAIFGFAGGQNAVHLLGPGGSSLSGYLLISYFLRALNNNPNSKTDFKIMDLPDYLLLWNGLTRGFQN